MKQLNILKNKFFQNSLLLIIFALAFYFVYYKRWEEQDASLKKAVYVRVKINDINTSMRGGPYFYYKYKINNVLFEDSQTIANTTMVKESKEKIKSNLGKYFYLKVSKEKPNYNDLLLEYSVIDTTLIQPKQGWKELPEKVKSNYSRKDFF
jgi:hypothetical protein